jgi:hypothetical protein
MEPRRFVVVAALLFVGVAVVAGALASSPSPSLSVARADQPAQCSYEPLESNCTFRDWGRNFSFLM